MKTQISKEGFRADKRYSGVYQQQGRLITDRDWNELVEIFKARLDDALADVVGSGSPKQKAAAISIAGGAPKIAPGVIYAGGVEARLVAAPGINTVPFGYLEQADFPSPPPLPAAGTAYRLYADLWERPVVSLEDQDLRDAGLHGADTCTRTQTMAQVKWCPVSKDPESPADNPGRGNALLTVAFPQSGGPAGSDPCDPQTQQVDPVGSDFLFRLEVHDARWPANAAPNSPDRVVVKWSRENGSEQFLYEDMPDWFTAGPWLYELFGVDTEKHPGFHLATSPGWTPKRGTLTATLPPTAPAGVTAARRWDGYCVLVRTGNNWAVSNTAGETPADTAPGAQVQVSSGKLVVNLTDLELTLELAGKILLPGDYWSTAVRRAMYQPGAELLKATPMGVLHRYVTLAEVQANGQLKPRTAQEQRKLAFPRLSDLDAGDVGYVTSCGSGLFDTTHDSVKKALDRLCSIAAPHVGYNPPGPTSVYRDRNPMPDTVAEALNLLADVQARHVLYSTPKDSNIGDVKQALDALFDRQASGGNRYTVGEGGDFGSIPDAISELQTQDTVALALMPGVHELEGFDLGGMIPQARLSILGLGLGSRIVLTGDFELHGLLQLELQNVAIEVREEGQISIAECPDVSLDNCWIERPLSFSSKPLMVIDVENVTGRVLVRRSLFDVLPTAPDAAVGGILQGLNEDIPDLLAAGLSHFRPRVEVLAAGVGAMTQAQRTALGQAIRSRLPVGPLTREQAACHSIATVLETSPFHTYNLEDAFERLRRTVALDNPGTALVLQRGRAATLLEGNDIRGRIGLYGPPAQGQLDLNLAWNRQKGGINTMGGQGGDLQLRNNRVTGIRVSDTMINWIHQFNPNNTPVVFPDPILNLVLTDNRIDGVSNTLIARNIKLNSTNFTGVSTEGWILGEKGIYVGNHGEGSTSTQTAFTDLTKSASATGTLNLTFTRLP